MHSKSSGWQSDQISYKGQTKHACSPEKNNATAMTYLNKMGATFPYSKPDCERNTGILHGDTCTHHNHCGISARLTNQIADLESRNVKEISINNWRLNPKIFNQINKVTGPIMLDLFADRWSAQVPSYVSWDMDPIAVSTDAFLTNFGENKKLMHFPNFAWWRDASPKFRGRREIVIIIPSWQTQPYYPLLLQMIIQSPMLQSP